MYGSGELEASHVRLAAKEDLPALVRIWQAGFGDEEEDITHFFDTFGESVRVPVYVENDKAVSMLCMLPAEFADKDGVQPVYYLYAVCTLPEYRGRGCSTEVLAYALGLCSDAHRGAILVPAGRELRDFYAKRGFTGCCTEEVIELSASEERRECRDISMCEEKARELLPMTPEEYTACRDTAFLGQGYVKWDGRTVAYAAELNRAEGGSLCRICMDGYDIGVMYRVEHGKIQFLEITASDREEACAAARRILYRMGLRSGSLRRSYYAMGAGLTGSCSKKGCCNLVLD